MNIPSKFKEAKEELICYTKTQINNNSTDTVKATLKGRTTNWLVFVWSKDKFYREDLPSRMPKCVDINKINNWIDIMKDSFNLYASGENEYGIVISPK